MVLLEDLGALIGLVLALTGLTMEQITGDAIWDGVATLLIGVLLVSIAVILVVEMKSLLIGESATTEHQAAIRAAIEGTPDVRGLIHMRTLHLGPDELLVAAKIDLPPDLDATRIAEAIDAAEARVRAAVPIARVIYLEPDLRDPAAPEAQSLSWHRRPTPRSSPNLPRGCGCLTPTTSGRSDAAP